MIKKVISQQSSVNSRAREQGFTLIEILLASFIFMTVVVIAIGSFTSQIALQGTSEAQRNVQQTAQSIVETISRDIRTTEEFAIAGGSSSCSGSPYQTVPNGACGSRLEFDTSNPNRRDYRLQGQEIRLCAPGCSNVLNDSTKVVVTDFYVEGVVPNMSDRLSQLVQPFAIIHLSLETPPGSRESAGIRVRTMVTSRLFEKYR